jgi:TM2 domain-containing membrane protein YozV
MEIYELDILKRMSPDQRGFFQAEFNSVRKSPTTGVLLALFLGGVGAHRFYLRQVGVGVIYVLLCWTFIPAIVGLIECFFMGARVDEWNLHKAYEISKQISALHPSTTLDSVK